MEPTGTAATRTRGREATDSPANKAGIQRGDIVVGLAGKPIDELGDIHRALAWFEPGETVNLAIYRDKQPQKLQLTFGSAPAMERAHGRHHGADHHGHRGMHPYGRGIGKHRGMCHPRTEQHGQPSS